MGEVIDLAEIDKMIDELEKTEQLNARECKLLVRACVMRQFLACNPPQNPPF